MAVSISKPEVDIRGELNTLRAKLKYEERQFWFDGLVTNGDFATGDLTGWTDLSTGTANPNAISGAAVLERIDSSNIAIIEQAVTTVAGSTYCISGTVSGGTVYVWVGTSSLGSQILNNNSNTTFNFTFEAQGTTTYITHYSATNGASPSIDNISVFEVDANDDVVHRMPKGWVPLHVYEDGLLQREGAAHDYEVVYDGFDYYVKPTVAPTATTETCVIGVRK